MWTGAPLPAGMTGPVGDGDSVGAVDDALAVGGATEVLALVTGGELEALGAVRAVQPVTARADTAIRPMSAAIRRCMRGCIERALLVQLSLSTGQREESAPNFSSRRLRVDFTGYLHGSNAKYSGIR
jgi:hypothetical protein